MNTYDIFEAAAIAKVHPDTLRKMAKRKAVPATKVGRAWVFPVHLLDSWIENKCLSTAAQAPQIGGAKYPSLATRLANRRKQRIEKKQKSLSSASESDSGGSIS